VSDGEVRVVDRRPAGLLAVPGLFVPVAVCGIPGHTDSVSRIATEVAVLAVVVGIVGFESTAGAGLVVIVSSLLSLNGFVEDRYGQLGWHPGVDLRVAAVLCASWALAYAARRGVDQRHPYRLSEPARYHAQEQELESEDGDR
jgi:hypothetical protein